jgi:hypothetical protein
VAYAAATPDWNTAIIDKPEPVPGENSLVGNPIASDMTVRKDQIKRRRAKKTP